MWDGAWLGDLDACVGLLSHFLFVLKKDSKDCTKNNEKKSLTSNNGEQILPVVLVASTGRKLY